MEIVYEYLYAKREASKICIKIRKIQISFNFFQFLINLPGMPGRSVSPWTTMSLFKALGVLPHRECLC